MHKLDPRSPEALELPSLERQLAFADDAAAYGGEDKARAALAADPKNLEASYALASALAARGQAREALEQFLDIVVAQPQVPGRRRPHRHAGHLRPAGGRPTWSATSAAGCRSCCSTRRLHWRAPRARGKYQPESAMNPPADMDALFARAQMAYSLGFHIIFAAVGIAMPLLMVMAEIRWLRTRDPEYLELARRWAKGTAVFFAVGAVSGTVLSFELGLLFPGFMHHAGAIVGLPFSLEGFAFFTEAIFLGIYLYGWERVSPACTWPRA